jgi:hypothetical protein
MEEIQPKKKKAFFSRGSRRDFGKMIGRTCHFKKTKTKTTKKKTRKNLFDQRYPPLTTIPTYIQILDTSDLVFCFAICFCLGLFLLLDVSVTHNSRTMRSVLFPVDSFCKNKTKKRRAVLIGFSLHMTIPALKDKKGRGK